MVNIFRSTLGELLYFASLDSARNSDKYRLFDISMIVFFSFCSMVWKLPLAEIARAAPRSTAVVFIFAHAKYQQWCIYSTLKKISSSKPFWLILFTYSFLGKVNNQFLMVYCQGQCGYGHWMQKRGSGSTLNSLLLRKYNCEPLSFEVDVQITRKKHVGRHSGLCWVDFCNQIGPTLRISRFGCVQGTLSIYSFWGGAWTFDACWGGRKHLI